MLRLPVAPAHPQQQQQTPGGFLSLTKVQPVYANLSPIALHDLKRSWDEQVYWQRRLSQCLSSIILAYEYRVGQIVISAQHRGIWHLSLS